MSGKPSSMPSESPSVSAKPSSQPSSMPSVSIWPTSQPSMTPSISGKPSFIPSESPSVSAKPSSQPSEYPSISGQPSSIPSSLPTSQPSRKPSISLEPSSSSSPSTISVPSLFPSLSDWPTSQPSLLPSTQPSQQPSFSGVPSSQVKYISFIVFSICLLSSHSYNFVLYNIYIIAVCSMLLILSHQSIPQYLIGQHLNQAKAQVYQRNLHRNRHHLQAPFLAKLQAKLLQYQTSLLAILQCMDSCLMQQQRSITLRTLIAHQQSIPNLKGILVRAT